jgi:CRP/FNR family transcriptional regulator
MMEEYRAALHAIFRLALPNTAAGRLANLLRELRGEHIVKGDGNRRFAIPLTHREIGEMTRTSRETTTRNLQRFKQDDLVRVKRCKLTVVHPRALERLAA